MISSSLLPQDDSMLASDNVASFILKGRSGESESQMIGRGIKSNEDKRNTQVESENVYLSAVHESSLTRMYPIVNERLAKQNQSYSQERIVDMSNSMSRASSAQSRSETNPVLSQFVQAPQCNISPNLCSSPCFYPVISHETDSDQLTFEKLVQFTDTVKLEDSIFTDPSFLNFSNDIL